MGNCYKKYNLEPVSYVKAARQSGEISQDGKIFETKYKQKSVKSINKVYNLHAGR